MAKFHLNICNHPRVIDDEGRVLLFDRRGNANFFAADNRVQIERILRACMDELLDFGYVLVEPGQIRLLVDRTRTWPFYYAFLKDAIFVSDDASWIRVKLQQHQLDEDAVLEFRLSGFVSGNRTLWREIRTVPAGTILSARWNQNEWEVSEETYFQYLPAVVDSCQSQPLRELGERFEEVFSKIISKCDGRPLVVPLSGGLDSRFILLCLKRHGARNVTAYTFGKADSHDCKGAMRCADKLGYACVHVPLAPTLWRSCIEDKNFTDLQKRYSGYCSLQSSQEYPAMVSLQASGKLPDDAVVLPGHTGDFISGGHIPKNLYSMPETIDSAIDYILDKHYGLWWSSRDARKQIRKRIFMDLKHLDGGGHETIASAIEYYDWKERQAKFIIPFVNVYKFFNLEFMMPLWGRNIIDFFCRLPLEYKWKQSLYRKYLMSIDDYGVFGNLDVVNVACERKPIGSKAWQNAPCLLRRIMRWFKTDVILKLHDAFFANSVNYYAPFSVWEILSGIGRFRNPNSFFVKRYLCALRAGMI